MNMIEEEKECQHLYFIITYYNPLFFLYLLCQSELEVAVCEAPSRLTTYSRCVPREKSNVPHSK